MYALLQHHRHHHHHIRLNQHHLHQHTHKTRSHTIHMHTFAHHTHIHTHTHTHTHTYTHFNTNSPRSNLDDLDRHHQRRPRVRLDLAHIQQNGLGLLARDLLLGRLLQEVAHDLPEGQAGCAVVALVEVEGAGAIGRACGYSNYL